MARLGLVGLRVEGFGFRVSGFGFRVWVEGVGVRVQYRASKPQVPKLQALLTQADATEGRRGLRPIVPGHPLMPGFKV